MKKQKITVSNIIGMFHEVGLFLPTRTIYFGGTTPWGDDDVVTSRTVAELIKNLHILECEKIAPIILLLNTVGGSWNDGIAVYDIIKALKSPVIIMGVGKVMSMGSIILQAGDRRILTENTDMLCHDGRDGFYGDTKSFENWAKVAKRIREQMYQIYYSRMKEKNKKITLAEIEEMCSHDSIFTADEAIKLGLADEKVQKVSKNVRKTSI